LMPNPGLLRLETRLPRLRHRGEGRRDGSAGNHPATRSSVHAAGRRPHAGWSKDAPPTRVAALVRRHPGVRLSSRPGGPPKPNALGAIARCLATACCFRTIEHPSVRSGGPVCGRPRTCRWTAAGPIVDLVGAGKTCSRAAPRPLVVADVLATTTKPASSSRSLRAAGAGPRGRGRAPARRCRAGVRGRIALRFQDPWVPIL